MKREILTVAVATLMVIAAGVTPATAAGLLGGITDTVTDTVSDVTDTVTDTVGDLTGGGGGDSLVSINNGDTDGLVDVDLLNGDEEVLSASAGGVKASVTSAGLLSNTVISLDLAGLGLDLTVDIGTPGPGGPNPGRGDDGVILVGSLGGGGTFVVNCAVNNTRQLLQIAAQGKITASEIGAWQRSANVQVIPIKLCPAAKKQIAKILAKSQKINLLRRAVMADALITASLGRPRYDAGDVVAVQRRSGQLVVYVY